MKKVKCALLLLLAVALLMSGCALGTKAEETIAPTAAPTLAPTEAPTQLPTAAPTEAPTQAHKDIADILTAPRLLLWLAVAGAMSLVGIIITLITFRRKK